MTALTPAAERVTPQAGQHLLVRWAIGCALAALAAALVYSWIATTPAAPGAPAASTPAPDRAATAARAGTSTGTGAGPADPVAASAEALERARTDRRAPAGANAGPDIDALLARLKERLARQPDDADGWLMLAHSTASLERHADAAQAYARAAALRPQDGQIRADWADAVAMKQGGTARGEPTRLLDEALRLDPRNVKAQVMSGLAALERQDRDAARGHFEAALALAEPGSDLARAMRQRLESLPTVQPAAPQATAR